MKRSGMVRIPYTDILFVESKNSKCILKNISLDIIGQCTQCIYVNIEPEYLQAQKEKQLKRLEED